MIEDIADCNMLYSCVCRWGTLRMIPYWVDEFGIECVEVGYKYEVDRCCEPKDVCILEMNGAFEIAHWGL